ncbi:MAG TPA: RagB/SusD family nutrient uptake outer membrane protein, partial [Puia sp.]|nr:RagB/SusD family nutrient uptake outer membrane protein [Puia sp.]
MRLLFQLMNRVWLFLALVALGAACNKDKFLDKKPTTTLLIPSTLSDFQALLDNVKVFTLVPTLGEASADNYYVSYKAWQVMTTREYNAYVWAKDIYGAQAGQQDWDVPYQQVFYANVVLDGLKNIKMSADSMSQWNALEGAALFCRAFAFYNLAQLFAPVYDSTTAGSDLGIPLRTTPSIDTLSARSSVEATYRQILNDLHEAEGHLPGGVPGAALNRPVVCCAQALLARVYLSMRKYSLAKACADSALQTYSLLMDYNDL